MVAKGADCRFGDACKFSHDVGAAPAAKKPQQTDEQRAAADAKAKAAAAAKAKAEEERQAILAAAAAAAEAEKKAAEQAAAEAHAAAEALKPLQLRAIEKELVVLDQKKAPKAERLAALANLKALCEGKDFRVYEPFLLAVLVPALLPLLDDKMGPVRDAATSLYAQVVELTQPHAVAELLRQVVIGCEEEAKWRCKVACLNAIVRCTKHAPTETAACLPMIVPVVTPMVWDTRQEVVDAATEAVEAVVSVVDNPDLEHCLPDVIKSMLNPKEVVETIHIVASTTFVQPVSAAALSIIVPLLVRGFREKQAAVKRQCAVIASNMSKLVVEPSEAQHFLPELTPSLEKASQEISDPEARGVAEQALAQLHRIQAAIDAHPVNNRAVAENTFNDVLQNYGDILEHYAATVTFGIEVGTSLMHEKNTELADWREALSPALSAFSADADALVATIMEGCAKGIVRKDEGDDDDAEDLCNINFTLAYGTKILLHNTQLRIKRGYCYGLLGGNDCGKTTLMRSMVTGQLEGFPTELRTVFVDADIKEETSHYNVLDYVYLDEAIQACNVSREDVGEVLASVGFTEQMQTGPVANLSGGWRVKLALSRAMLQKADILLMDEPTSHLDVRNVRWVLEWIKNLKGVTCIMVSHDSKFLDECCTHILHFQDLKLHLEKGNLSDFVTRHPEAQCYFELKSSKQKFVFPQPGFIEGVKSKGRALMRMTDCTFTYPGCSEPTIYNVSIQLSLSSRVAVVGPNGAGKSTMIKLLTGDLVPQTGTVWQHQNLRTAVVGQYSFEYLDHHLKKTPNEYIRWRYENAFDRENTKKENMQVSEEEAALLAQPIMFDVDIGDGKTKKEKRVIECLGGGRREAKRGFEYEVQWQGKPVANNVYMPGEKLEALGWGKHMKMVDMKVEARERAYTRPLTTEMVEKHLGNVGLAPEFATHNRIGALSGGQKVKVVLAACLWYQPHIVILDEPTNYLDRDSLGALAEAIKEFEGGVCLISHNDQFCCSVANETWVMDAGHLTAHADDEDSWMKKAAEKVEFTMIEEMTDGMGNKVAVKAGKKKLSRKEQKERARKKKLALEAGQPWSDSEDEDW
jgi:elongation factor 3